MSLPDGVWPRLPINARALLSGFTSLGDNCEFALVQRRAGVERLGLLRFAFSPFEGLLASVRDGFADLDPLEAVRVEQPWDDEFITFFGRHGFHQHTFLRTGDADPARLRARETTRIPFLRRRLLEDLAQGETVFVRKSNTHAPAEMAALHHALQRHGGNTLLWVEAARDGEPACLVERLGPGLLRGTVDRFAPYGDATAIAFDSWLALCVRASRALGRDAPQAAPAPTCPGAGAPHGTQGQDCAPAHGVPPLLPGGPVFRHHAGVACRGMAALCPTAGLATERQTCTATLWLWLPAALRGRLIAPVLVDAANTLVQPAILVERDCWQRIWVSGGLAPCTPVGAGIWADLDQGDVFYTTHWTVTQDDGPPDYLLEGKRVG